MTMDSIFSAPWTFHPLEMALVGYQNSGKTHLASRLIGALRPLEVAYVKRDAHRFTMDHPGKDTHTLASAGASAVFISDPGHRALLRPRPVDPILSRLDFLDDDAVLVEGHKQSPVPKIMVLDEGMQIVHDPAFGGHVPLAAVGPWSERPDLPWPVPYFHRDDTGSVAAFIRGYWDFLLAERPLHGLVLTRGGGETRRVFDLLTRWCRQVFVSCRADRSDLPGARGLPQVHDRWPGLGPLSGILAAFDHSPDAAWLVVDCDLPGLGAETLLPLVEHRDPFRFATAYEGSGELPEPFCTLYEPKARPRLLQYLATGSNDPRALLTNSPVRLLTAQDRRGPLHAERS